MAGLAEPSARRWMAPLAHVAAAAALAALLVATIPLGYVNIDQAWTLAWGDEILAGRLPSYDAPHTPTPHPLATTLGAIAALAGPGGGERLLTVFAAFSLACAGWILVLIGRELAGWAAGAVAGGVLVTSVVLLLRTMAGTADIHVLALVVAAVLVEVRRPRAGRPVLVLLALAGLQRPEAWAISGLYWLWLLPGTGTRARVTTALLAAAAPLAWTLGDLIVTGDPLFSFVQTRDATLPADPASPRHGAPTGDEASDGVVEVSYLVLRNVLRLPVLAGGLAGLALVLAVRLRAAAPVVALAAVWLAVVVTFFVVAGLPFDDRFLYPVAAMLVVLFGVAALGWRAAPPGRLRQVWLAGGLVLLASLAASVPDRIGSVERVVDAGGPRAAALEDLRELLGRPATRAVLGRCQVVYTPNYRLLPYTSFAGGLAPARVVAAPEAPPARGAFIVAASSVAATEILLSGQGAVQRPRRAPADARPRAANASWRLLSRGC